MFESKDGRASTSAESRAILLEAHYQSALFSLGRDHSMPIHTNIAPEKCLGSRVLEVDGFNLMAEIRPAGSKGSGKAVFVLAHLDTGSNYTIIDETIHGKLGLVQDGFERRRIGDDADRVLMPMYKIDLKFPETELGMIVDLRVGTLKLPLTDMKSPINSENIGLLIGRDVMTRWNIVWNGPTSTVFISD